MVVIMSPGGEHRPSLRQAGEDRLVEAFVPEPGVEALDKPVLLRLAPRDVVLLDITLL